MRWLLAWDERVMRLGRKVLRLTDQIWLFMRFAFEMFRHLPQIFRNFHLTVEQMYLMGITSIPLVALTSIFSGAVAAWQSAYNFADYVPLRYVGTAVGKSVM